MAKVYLGLGSNISPQKHIKSALKALRALYGDIELSPIYESEAVGFKGDNFLNLVARINTELSVGELQAALKDLEHKNGRTHNAAKFSGRTLDIDILLYDDTVGTIDGVKLPRGEILINAFVLRPLAELAPEARHPESLQTMSQLWTAYDANKQKLWPVNLTE